MNLGIPMEANPSTVQARTGYKGGKPEQKVDVKQGDSTSNIHAKITQPPTEKEEETGKIFEKTINQERPKRRELEGKQNVREQAISSNPHLKNSDPLIEKAVLKKMQKTAYDEAKAINNAKNPQTEKKVDKQQEKIAFLPEAKSEQKNSGQVQNPQKSQVDKDKAPASSTPLSASKKISLEEQVNNGRYSVVNQRGLNMPTTLSKLDKGQKAALFKDKGAPPSKGLDDSKSVKTPPKKEELQKKTEATPKTGVDGSPEDSESETSGLKDKVSLKPGSKEEMLKADTITDKKEGLDEEPAAPSYIPADPTLAQQHLSLTRALKSENNKGVSDDVKKLLESIVDEAKRSPLDRQKCILENLVFTASTINFIPAGVKDKKEDVILNKDDMKLLKENIKELQKIIKTQQSSSVIDVSKMKVEDMADDLFNRGAELFSQMKTSEILGRTISNKAGLQSFVDHLDQVQGFVSESILKCKTPKERAKLISKYIDLSVMLKNKGDYNTPFVIAMALKSSQTNINKLKKTWLNVSKSKLKNLSGLDNLYESYGRFKNLEEEYKKLDASNKVYMPLVAAFSANITMWGEGNELNYQTAENSLNRLISKLASQTPRIDMPLIKEQSDFTKWIDSSDIAKDLIYDIVIGQLVMKDIEGELGGGQNINDPEVQEEIAKTKEKTLKSLKDGTLDKADKKTLDDAVEGLIENMFKVQEGVQKGIEQGFQAYAPAVKLSQCIANINKETQSDRETRKTDINQAIAMQDVDLNSRNLLFQQRVDKLTNSPNEILSMKHPQEPEGQ